MGRYLDRLKKSENTGGGTLQNHQNLVSMGFVGFEGRPPAPFQKIEGTAANDSATLQPPAVITNTSSVWLLHFTDREPLEVWFAPAVSYNEALKVYPEAVAAEPLADPAIVEQSAQESADKPAARCCRTCRHLKRPGLSAGYCDGRDDLPPAYGPGHPLQRLPDDGGASCGIWENRP